MQRAWALGKDTYYARYVPGTNGTAPSLVCSPSMYFVPTHCVDSFCLGGLCTIRSPSTISLGPGVVADTLHWWQGSDSTQIVTLSCLKLPENKRF
jgi:hypothetical protein